MQEIIILFSPLLLSELYSEEQDSEEDISQDLFADSDTSDTRTMIIKGQKRESKTALRK